jgi:hypothetical protein
MTNTLRIKRRISGATGAPGTLANAELAFNEVDSTLYYGVGTGGAGGSATSVLAIGGPGAFVGLTGNQTIAGTKTFSSTISGSINGNANTATTLATGRTISISGDITYTSPAFDGSTNVSATGTLATVNSNVGTFTKLTVNAKGLVTAASAATLADLGATAADFSMNSYKITNLATPVAATDAANKGYVDGLLNGISWKNAVVVATVTTGTLATSFANGQVIDGYTLATGDRILIKNQATAAENGIYTVNSSGAPTRAVDMDSWAEVINAAVFVQKGTANADLAFVCTSDAGGTLGSTAINFVQFSSAGSYSAGNGLQLTGTTFSVLANGSTIDVSSSGIKVSDTYPGNTSLTTLGTVSTGTWNASTIAVAYGGTGASSFTSGALLKGAGTSAITTATAGTDYLDPNSTIDCGTF